MVRCCERRASVLGGCLLLAVLFKLGGCQILVCLAVVGGVICVLFSSLGVGFLPRGLVVESRLGSGFSYQTFLAGAFFP